MVGRNDPDIIALHIRREQCMECFRVSAPQEQIARKVLVVRVRLDDLKRVDSRQDGLSGDEPPTRRMFTWYVHRRRRRRTQSWINGTGSAGRLR